VSLIANVTARFSNQRLVNLTRPDAGHQTTADTTVLGYACTDVEGLIQVYAGVEYDDTDARHVAIACDGVVALLESRIRSIGGAEEANPMVAWRARARELGKVSGRDKVTPSTRSQYTPSPDLDPGATTVQPAFDRRRFDELVLDDPEVGERT
jgi:hypothetical protein